MTTKEIREKGYDSIDQFLQGLQVGKFSCFADFPVKDHGPFSQSFDFAKNLIDKHCLVGYKHYDHSNPGGIVYLTDEGMKVNDCGGIRQYLNRNLAGTTSDEKSPSRLNDLITAVECIRPSEDHSLYCIWHGFPLNGHGYNLGIQRSVVDKLVKSYLKGEGELTISGRTYHIGSEKF